MRRADRLFRLLQHLRDGRLHRAVDLAAVMEVSQRTIYRDVADLMASGVPIEGEAGMGYVMGPGYDLPPLMFTERETAALVAGTRILQAWGGAEMALGAAEALSKLETILPDTARQRAASVKVQAMRMPQITDALRLLLDQLEDAAEAETRLKLRYADADGHVTERIVRPLGLWFWGKVWTLTSWCELRDDFRMFRADRIRAADPCGPFRSQPGQTLRDFYARECDQASDGADWAR